MRYAFMSFSTPDLTLAEMLALAAQLGYDGIEPRLDAGHRHGIECDLSLPERQAIKAQVADTGIALCCLATSCQYANPATLPKMLDDTRRAIDLAGAVGAPRLRVFGGLIPDGISREQATDQCITSLAALAPHAAEQGVTLCLETHDAWCDPAHVIAILRAVNHPCIAVNWDIMHPVRAAGCTMDAAFAALKPWIRHLHVHDGVLGEPAALMPIGEGAIDHRRAIELLHTIAYDGYLSGEWIGWEPYQIHLPRELATLRRYAQETQQAQGQETRAGA